MDELVLVRHAETEWSGRRYCGRTDLPLTTRGEAMARRLGREIAGSLPRAVRIVSSPLLRARQTAVAIAAAAASDEVVVDDRWAETDFGAAEGLTYEELERALPQVATRLVLGEAMIDWPEGETASALRTRVEAAWRDLTGRPGSVVVVSHGGPLRIAIALALEVFPADVTVPAPGTVWRRGRSPVLRFPA
jgi:broad specificity phosphatase PhoE